MKNIKDRDLVLKVKDGDRMAFSELVLRHQQALFHFIFRYVRSEELTEDIVQDAFIKAYTKIASFEQRASFKSWLFRIALNVSKNKLRGAKNQPKYDIENVHLGELAQAENALVYEAVKKRVQEQIGELPEKQKQALHLRIFEDMPFKEIAEIMDCPYDTAKANYRHALMKLKEACGEEQVLKDWLSSINQELEVTEAAIGVER